MGNVTTGKVAIGDKVFIAAGKQYKRFGQERKQRSSYVTVRKVAEDKRSGKTRIFWVSQGVEASTLV